ncbi:S-layer homology domain-containing protein [Paenibacillus sp. R14(2021)]|uniref:S-layer homology domain-containing protein n=1 Tax=Paenibacillus sp. R14(2021) TaxID=2859228 RepID=UPI001C61615E|nr:S-layer homology domain-containing protein [Paenibacillus sp. R14(2021)]
MKKLLMNKTAAVIVFAMIVSVFTPIIAFAASFVNVSNNGNVVTGSITLTDAEYTLLSDQSKVAVSVYGKNGDVSTVYATYDASVGHGTFKFTHTITQDTYFYYPLDPTKKTQYFTYTAPVFGGGGFFLPEPINADGTVNRDALLAALKASDNTVVSSKSDVVFLPADILIQGKSLTIVLENGTSYTLPIAALKLEELAKSLGVELKDLVIRVELKQVTGDTATKITDAVTKAGGKELATAVDFKVIAVANGKEQVIDSFNQYVSRTIVLKEAAASNDNLVGVVFDPATGKLSYVPATFVTKDGKTVSTLKRNGNSIYTVIQTKAVSFTDLAGNWAQKDVEALAGKMIVNGTSANKFEPKRSITRAEFAAMVVRALGLEVSGTASQFKDVASNQWYAATVATAVKAGLITGYEDGTFKPNANITRKELSAIIARAMKFAGKDVTLTDAQVSTALASFKDASSLGWAKGEVAVVVSEGIVKGQTATTVVGNANANRAEAATMIARFLGNVGFSN